MASRSRPASLDRPLAIARLLEAIGLRVPHLMMCRATGERVWPTAKEVAAGHSWLGTAEDLERRREEAQYYFQANLGRGAIISPWFIAGVQGFHTPLGVALTVFTGFWLSLHITFMAIETYKKAILKLAASHVDSSAGSAPPMPIEEWSERWLRWFEPKWFDNDAFMARTGVFAWYEATLGYTDVVRLGLRGFIERRATQYIRPTIDELRAYVRKLQASEIAHILALGIDVVLVVLAFAGGWMALATWGLIIGWFDYSMILMQRTHRRRTSTLLKRSERKSSGNSEKLRAVSQ